MKRKIKRVSRLPRSRRRSSDPAPAVPVFPSKIAVEVISAADVERLEARYQACYKEYQQLRGEFQGLHRSFYELLEAFGRLKSR